MKNSEKSKMKPKQFIKQVFIGEFGQIINNGHHYIGFGLLSIGIEFLGKCLQKRQKWHQSGTSGPNFNKAIQELMPKYQPFNKKYKLHDGLRNGFAHAFAPKKGVFLTHRKENPNHLQENGGVTLVIEDFYEDFKKACEAVIQKKFDPDDKMNKEYLSTPSSII